MAMDLLLCSFAELFADRCNNDHVLSSNGKMIAISHHTKEAGGKSLIYTLPVSGGEPKQVTVNGPSYLSPPSCFSVRGNVFSGFRH